MAKKTDLLVSPGPLRNEWIKCGKNVFAKAAAAWEKVDGIETRIDSVWIYLQ